MAHRLLARIRSDRPELGNKPVGGGEGEPPVRGSFLASHRPAVDTAFALGVPPLAGLGVPDRVRTYMLTFAIADGLAGIVVIALVYSGHINAAGQGRFSDAPPYSSSRRNRRQTGRLDRGRPHAQRFAGKCENPRAWLRYPTVRTPDRCERACCSSLCRIGGNLAVVGHEYMVSKHRGGRAPQTRFRVAGGKGIR